MSRVRTFAAFVKVCALIAWLPVKFAAHEMKNGRSPAKPFFGGAKA